MPPRLPAKRWPWYIVEQHTHQLQRSRRLNPKARSIRKRRLPGQYDNNGNPLNHSCQPHLQEPAHRNSAQKNTATKGQ